MVKAPQAQTAVQAAIDTVRSEIQELRGFIAELRPSLLLKFGLAKAIRSHAEGLMGKHPALRINFDVEEETPPLPEPVRLGLYRIYQEALTNVIKHAQATEVGIQFRIMDHTAFLEIQDNGTGFTLPREWLDLARLGHLGLVGMRERAEAVGGSLHVHSRPKHGTTLQVQVPLTQAPLP
jgi:signal transduction histidine kinase